MNIIEKSICYPKSETIIIPGNLAGIMTKGVLMSVVKDGFKGIEKEAKEILQNSTKEIGSCISTYPGRLNRRGIKRIYHAIIKRFPNDITTSFIVKKALRTTIETIIQDGFKSVSICGIGVDQGDVDSKIVAKIIFDMYNIYKNDIDIKIVDDNKYFINECMILGKINGIIK